MSEFVEVPVPAGAWLRMFGPLVEASAILVRDEIVTTMDPGPARTGRQYFVPGTRTKYTASAEGQPPAVRTAAYRDSWVAGTPAESNGVVRADAFSAMRTEDGRYSLGGMLEYGTTRMRARPHIRVAIRTVASKIEALARAFSA